MSEENKKANLILSIRRSLRHYVPEDMMMYLSNFRYGDANSKGLSHQNITLNNKNSEYDNKNRNNNNAINMNNGLKSGKMKMNNNNGEDDDDHEDHNIPHTVENSMRNSHTFDGGERINHFDFTYIFHKVIMIIYIIYTVY